MPPRAKKEPKEKKDRKEKKVSKKAAADEKKKAETEAALGSMSLADRLAEEGIIATCSHNARSMHRNFKDINVLNFSITYFGKVLMEECDIALNYGRRYGLIGRNGSGKSTFMNVLGARGIPIPDSIDIYHLKHEIEASDMTALEAVLSVDEERKKLQTEVDELSELMTDDSLPEEQSEAWNKILLMISHSQEFMNEVCTNIIELTSKKLVYYAGNYDTYVKTKAEKEENQMKRYNWEQDQIKHMKDYIARFGHGSAKLARQAQSKEKTLEKMVREGLTERVQHEATGDFKFPNPEPIPPPVLMFQNVAFGYPGQPLLYSNVEMGLDLDSRVALVGANGTGKTTLLKLITGDLVAVSGNVRPHSKLRIARFSQHFVDVLDLEQTPLVYFRSLFPTKSVEDFQGGMLLVSHDMRLISQVAKEIWIVEGQRIRVYEGEIADFKMQVRKQLKLGDK
ncbi:hypothetical protein PybrP1_005942 [[Pythium] brassicae (nom. inval.)]|nr:hypothetical protein PybrP1_005942 [[Pythium] brassicae (nom. inval.)]